MKLHNFWWVLVVLAIFACGREGTTIDTILPPTNLVLERVGDDLIDISWYYENSKLDTTEVNQLVLERLIGNYVEDSPDWKEIYRLDIEDSTDYEYSDKDLIIQGNYSYRVGVILDGASSEWVTETLALQEITLFRFTHEGVLILEPGSSEYLEIELMHNDSTAVGADYEVKLTLTSTTSGTNINGALFNVEDSLMLNSKDGVVPITLNAGEMSGLVRIKASAKKYTTGAEVFTELEDILVQAAPKTAKIYPGGANSAQANGVFWSLDIGAYIEDSNEVPVEDGIGVIFSLLDNQDIFSIEENHIIGNTDQDGGSDNGMAYSKLKYFGIHTNRTVTLKVQCQNAIRVEQLLLPIQYPQFDLEVEPEAIIWEADDHAPKPCLISFRLRDGLNYPILDQEVQYYFLDAQGVEGEGFVGNVITSSESGSYGSAEFTWIFNEDDCPRPTEYATIYEAKIILSIPGLDESFEVPVMLVRNP